MHYTKPAFYVTTAIYSALFAGAVWSFDGTQQSANSINGEISPIISMELLSANIVEEPQPETEIKPEPEKIVETQKQEVVPDPTIKKESKQPKKEIKKEVVERKRERKKHHEHRKMHRPASQAVQSKAQGAPVTTQQQNLQGTGASSDELASYRSALRREIEKHKRYSQRAKMLHRQGTVVVQFTLMNDGSIQNVRLHRSSGYEELDQSAMDAVAKANSVGARPAGLAAEQKIPIKFMLR
ncbi:transport protein TonB [Gallibacterium anatis]|uniref:Protein TonB n=1 Tax=Gallibacterium anatis TaxID=750 RepID=A0A377H627_9PAST|nr:energy transducer TonB [Gallibacterium anatis]KGQ57892.1 energy transducer TonB [Gallibacterium anatis DSM 16844 = F 149]STO37951.1 transport protein TonB [Gallibacterium anatis]